ncbi:MAG TPA: sigma-54 dependent transcriptional regulator [Opitutaceae bacterium]|nr:sigma-54 dependent transcriptional regulator [Opitutaceae bacterium]
MNNANFRVLVVDDERGLCAGVQEALRREGYTVDAANDARTALGLIASRGHHVVVTDVRMPDMTGLQLLEEARPRHTDTQFILMTAYGTVENAVEAMKAGAYDYLTKPLDMQRLRHLVAKALAYRNVVAENNELRQRLKRKTEPSLLVGDSEPIRQVLRIAEEVARSDVTVLIEGESGTGKELVARMIHQRSARATKPFISVNCAAFAEQLLEGELFGHVRGAFTGAVTNKPGRFQLANGGTLFLDEIGDLPAKGQGDLLRVLEDGAFRMVGGTELVRVDVRIVAATNKRLQEAVAAGKFREDLFYRLQVVPIVVPPLRERPDDIPLLVESFLDHFSAKHKRRRMKLSPEAMQRCRRFPWPGNVRQLRNAIERLVVTCAGSVMNVADLPDFLQVHDSHAPGCEIYAGMTIAECEKLLIQHTLMHATTNREQAARLLGISRRALQYKLKLYGLLPPRRTAVRSSLAKSEVASGS